MIKFKDILAEITVRNPNYPTNFPIKVDDKWPLIAKYLEKLGYIWHDGEEITEFQPEVGYYVEPVSSNSNHLWQNSYHDEDLIKIKDFNKIDEIKVNNPNHIFPKNKPWSYYVKDEEEMNKIKPILDKLGFKFPSASVMDIDFSGRILYYDTEEDRRGYLVHGHVDNFSTKTKYGAPILKIK